MGAVRNGDVNAARKDIEQLETLKNTLTTAKQKYWADQVEIQRRAAAAWVAHAEGKKAEALKAMRSAAALEDASEKHVAMENRLWPMRELLGEMLLQLNEPAQALKEFEASFKVAPNRFRGYYGAAKAAERLQDQKKARSFYAKLVELCKQADGERPELVEAKAFLAKK
jgi:tetratricopeptide (TPR) repeat protein